MLMCDTQRATNRRWSRPAHVPGGTVHNRQEVPGGGRDAYAQLVPGCPVSSMPVKVTTTGSSPTVRAL